MSERTAILQALVIAFGFTGQTVQPEVLAMMAKELSAYPESDVLKALQRCRMELRFIHFQDILNKLPGQHPGKEEAWALIATVLKNEEITICWTDEMREASGVAFALRDDRVAARMAFMEKYQELVSQARVERRMPKWSISLGYDKDLRAEAVLEAQRKNQISEGYAAKLLEADLPREVAQQLLDDLRDELKHREDDDAR